jgi:hypothetical protein
VRAGSGAARQHNALIPYRAWLLFLGLGSLAGGGHTHNGIVRFVVSLGGLPELERAVLTIIDRSELLFQFGLIDISGWINPSLRFKAFLRLGASKIIGGRFAVNAPAGGRFFVSIDPPTSVV